MPDQTVTIIVPTLAADSALDECLRSLEEQTYKNLEVVVIDNSGKGLVRGRSPRATVIENSANAGFGTAINQGIRASTSPFVAALNDDAVASPHWIAALLDAANSRAGVGMCASQVRLYPDGRLDSAGMLLCADGSSKQRGHLRQPEEFDTPQEALLPSGSAALYRRSMLEEIGGFDDDFFLYCEDTDLGLRARWAGWTCLYVPEAVVFHRYSHSAGRASALKAYYVERNRLYVVVKNFPAGMLIAAPLVSLVRYVWHFVFLIEGKGAAAEFRMNQRGSSLIWLLVQAHWAMLRSLGSLLRKRREIRYSARLSSAEFRRLVKRHSISARRVAAH